MVLSLSFPYHPLPQTSTSRLHKILRMRLEAFPLFNHYSKDGMRSNIIYACASCHTSTSSHSHQHKAHQLKSRRMPSCKISMFVTQVGGDLALPFCAVFYPEFNPPDPQPFPFLDRPPPPPNVSTHPALSGPLDRPLFESASLLYTANDANFDYLSNDNLTIQFNIKPPLFRIGRRQCI